MKGLKYKHFFTVRNGKYIWDDPDMFRAVRMQMEGRRGYAIIEEEKGQKTLNQLGYYFGGIIRHECMSSDVFAGYTDRQIHSILFGLLRSETKGVKLPDGSVKLVNVSEDFSKYKIDDMTAYLEELIPFLQTEFDIHPKPPSHYKENRFLISPNNTK